MMHLFRHDPDGSVWQLRAHVGRKGPFGHSFGGPNLLEGVIPPGCEHEVHLLFDFDCRDERCGRLLPGAARLPLLFGFQYNAERIGYRILSDTKVEVVHIGNPRWLHDFPYAEFPREFPRMDVVVEDPVRLSRGERDAEAAIAKFIGRWQGPGGQPCDNPKCGRHRRQMRTFAYVPFDTVPGLSFWGEMGDGEQVQIFYEICPGCHTIHAHNECT